MGLFDRIFANDASKHAHMTSSINLDEKINVRIPNNYIEMENQVSLIDLRSIPKSITNLVSNMVEKNIDEVTDAFYSNLLQVDTLKNLIEKHTTVSSLRQTLKEHVLQMFAGTIDENYIETRKRIAHKHHIIKLMPKWYMGSFQTLQKLLFELVLKNIDNDKLRSEAFNCISVMINFEQQLVLEAYETEVKDAEEEAKLAREAKIKEQMKLISSELAGAAQTTNASIEELIASASLLNENVVETSDQYRKTKELAVEGHTSLKTLGDRMSSMNESMNRMQATVEQLKESSDQIKEIISIVQRIAEQTNLLSLNASIESARAGEHGRGFAVVANEVRKLSDETKHSVLQIIELVGKSTNLTSSVVTSIREVRVLVDGGVTESEKTVETYDTIMNSMEDTNNTISEIQREMLALVTVMDEIGTTSTSVASSAETLNDTAINL
ncbi:MAG: hemAT 1 [Bacillales bacterium]|jgi:heme-based aerotactic transducer|nr:hemAT 1 [Bacillales bacterium]